MADTTPRDARSEDVLDTIVTCCKDRYSLLVDGLKNWLQTKVKAIVVVDWSSADPIKYDDERVKIIRIEGQEWVQPKAFNLGALLVTSPVMCKLDTDYRINSDFLDEPLMPGTFWRGDWTIARNRNERHLNGFARFWMFDFFKVNGYNERLTGYGYDDTDFYKRLAYADIQPVIIKGDKIRHIEHDDKLRLVNTNQESTIKSLNANIASSNSNPWKLADKRTEYRVTKVSDRYYTATVV